MSNNVIEFLPGLKEMALRRIREKHAENITVDIGAINPSLEKEAPVNMPYINFNEQEDTQQDKVEDVCFNKKTVLNFEIYDNRARTMRFYILKSAII